METQQINLKLSKKLIEASKSYIENFGYRNIQDLAAECIREKVFSENEFDENFSDEEIVLIDKLIGTSIEKQDLISEEELEKTLLE